MRKVFLSVAVLLLVLPSSLFATAQQGDELMLDGKTYTISTEPLEGYLQKNPGKLPESNVTSTALWRGYVATWAIRDNRLMLRDVKLLQSVANPSPKGHSTELRSVMPSMFPGQEQVFADWFSGYLVVPTGKMMHYTHMGYASIYSNYVLLKIENGIVTKKEQLDSKAFVKFREKQFELFKESDEYKKALNEAETGETKMSAKENEEFLRQYYSGKYTSMIFE
jgi:hypothetical protein